MALFSSMLEDVLEHPQFGERHEITIRAGSGEVERALRSVTPQESRAFRSLFFLRALPARVRGRPALFDQGRPLLEQAQRVGFRLVIEEPHRLVLATMGRFWAVNDVRRRPPEDLEHFRSFADPGLAKTAVGFAWHPEGDGTRLITETRIRATSLRARVAFGAYWWVVAGVGSGLIRRSWLAAAKRRAEHGDFTY